MNLDIEEFGGLNDKTPVNKNWENLVQLFVEYFKNKKKLE